MFTVRGRALRALLPAIVGVASVAIVLAGGNTGQVQADTSPPPTPCLQLKARIPIPGIAADSGFVGSQQQALSAADMDVLEKELIKAAGKPEDFEGNILLPTEEYDRIVSLVLGKGNVQVQAQPLQAVTVFCGSTTPTATPSASPSPTTTATATSSATQSPTGTISPTGTATSTPTGTQTPTVTPSPSATGTVTSTPTPSPTLSPTNTPVPSIVPSPSPTQSPSPTPTPSPTNTPTPTVVSCVPGPTLHITIVQVGGMPASLPRVQGEITVTNWMWCIGNSVTGTVSFTSSPTAITLVDFTFFFDSGGPSDGYVERKLFSPSSGTANDGTWSTTWTVPADGTIVHVHGFDIIAQNGSTESFGGNPPGRVILSYRQNNP